LFGTLFGVPPREIAGRIDDALAWTGLQERSNEPVARFSGGMQRRLNIACGVLHRPDVILLDEPTVGVDPQSRQRIWRMLDELKQQGTAILLTTHQLDEAQQICDRIVIIDQGRTIASGTCDELIDATIGRQRHITFLLREECRALPDDYEVNGTTVSFLAADIVKDLPDRLKQLQASGADVLDLCIEAPTLQAVFLHLTGHELRENF
ncbi:MAG: ATP-binding cassette domain-containing protein, partial [Planctomycetaceae bacterium]|nr:ATP-binding cassette domain-containing protein [Planctomycetaceae bacterium]